MTTLTLESIKADPWNAVRLALPADADPELLQAALKAAGQCVVAAHAKVQGARDGELIPTGWREGGPDAHEFFEQDWLDALDRWEAIRQMAAA